MCNPHNLVDGLLRGELADCARCGATSISPRIADKRGLGTQGGVLVCNAQLNVVTRQVAVCESQKLRELDAGIESPAQFQDTKPSLVKSNVLKTKQIESHRSSSFYWFTALTSSTIARRPNA